MSSSIFFKSVTIFLFFVFGTTIHAKYLPHSHERSSSDLRYSVPLDQDNSIHLSWDLDFRKEKIIFRIRRPKLDPQSWFAFGMSGDGTLVNADLVFWWKTKSGNLRLKDTWTDDTGIVHIDGRQNVRVTGYSHDSTTEIISLKRKFDNCDPEDYVIEDGTVDLIYVTADDRFSSLNGLNVSEYKNGLQRVQLLKSQMPVPSFPDDVMILDVLAPSVEIPNSTTTYWCSTHRLPELTNKHHIIRFESIIPAESQGIVHHMEVFLCEDDVTEMYNAPCQTESKPKPIESCKHVLGAWAMGAQPFSYPKEAGVPLGGDNFPKFVVLEVHYNNLEQKAGIIDHSGIRFYYTPTLRPQDAGIMELGLIYTPKMAIPPQNAGFLLNGFCTPECTNEGLPEDGIKVFASQLHTHLTGVGVFTKHVRDGIELPTLNQDFHYSSHFQEIRLLKEQVTVLPGDLLITGCRYNTMDRSNVTLGGFGIKDEMCLNYIHYYPRTELEVCKSSLSKRAVNRFFTYMYRNAGMPLVPGGGVALNYKLITWSRTISFILQRVFRTGSIEMMCLDHSGSPLQGKWNELRQPRITQPLLTRDPCRSLGDVI
ncbi:dopamine beta-hydroxylase-like [Ptychodera flava]|uniref:dopamine beta-hydroxylase-like n=1 Tax=Ptychodera flava TaxID=63121 RepID=UPI00396A5FC7